MAIVRFRWLANRGRTHRWVMGWALRRFDHRRRVLCLSGAFSRQHFDVDGYYRQTSAHCLGEAVVAFCDEESL
jgi:hypothetical protein